jgi:hypothetical protein
VSPPSWIFIYLWFDSTCYRMLSGILQIQTHMKHYLWIECIGGHMALAVNIYGQEFRCTLMTVGGKWWKKLISGTENVSIDFTISYFKFSGSLNYQGGEELTTSQKLSMCISLMHQNLRIFWKYAQINIADSGFLMNLW